MQHEYLNVMTMHVYAWFMFDECWQTDISNTNRSRNQTPGTTSRERKPGSPENNQSAGNQRQQNLCRDESSVSVGKKSPLHRQKLPQKQLYWGIHLRDIRGIWWSDTKYQTHQGNHTCWGEKIALPLKGRVVNIIIDWNHHTNNSTGDLPEEMKENWGSTTKYRTFQRETHLLRRGGE